MSYDESYALQFDGRDDVLDCGTGQSLNLDGDLTIEATLRLPPILRRTYGVLSKGVMHSGDPDQNAPYALFIDQSGRLTFAFMDENGRSHAVRTPAVVGRDPLARIAVVRKKHHEASPSGANLEPLGLGDTIDNIDLDGNINQIDNNEADIDRAIRADYVASKQRQRDLSMMRPPSPAFPADSQSPSSPPPSNMTSLVTMEEGFEIKIYVNGRMVLETLLLDVLPGSTDQPLEIGKAYGRLTSDGEVEGSTATYFQGDISEVRIWNEGLSESQLHRHLTGGESGLVGWWRFEENAGNTVADSAGSNEAAINGARWIKDPDPAASTLMVRQNGLPVDTETMAAVAVTPNQFSLGRGYQGNLDEVRIWRTARTDEHILDNLFGRLKGEREDLIAYYTFDRDTTGNSARILDNGLRGNQLVPNNAGTKIKYVFSTAPISNDTALVRSALAGVRTAFQDVIHSRPAVEEYGDLQYLPSGDLVGALKRCYSFLKHGEWRLVTGFKVGAIITEWIGQVQFDPQVMGYIEGAPPVPSENLTPGLVNPASSGYDGATSLEITEADNVTYTIASSKESGANTSLTVSKGFELEKAKEKIKIIAPLGIGTGFSFELPGKSKELKTNGKFETSQGWSNSESQGFGANTSRNISVSLHGSWEDPDNPQIPAALEAQGRRFLPDNTGFAVVESQTADVFALRLAHNLSLISFRFRPNADIPRDVNLIPFPINPHYTKQGTLDGAVGYNNQGKILDPDYPNARGLGEYSYFKPREAYALRNRIQQEEQRLRAYYNNQDQPIIGPVGAAANAATALLEGAGGAGITGPIENAFVPSNEVSAFAEEFAKRNLVNTYVWTAAGGTFAESTQTTDVRQETTGSSYKLSGSFGASVDAGLFGLAFDLNASAGGNLNVTKTKTQDAQTTFGINTVVNTQRNLQQYDDNREPVFENGQPVIVEGKVDAYRFFTFYLEADPGNFDQLFNQVIDPIWLAQSSHPNAAALRQANNAENRPPCWRVFHRVTFVSRILPSFPDETMPPLEQALRAVNIESNWLLIQTLEPFVRNKTDDFGVFAAAVRDAVRRYLPELQPHTEEIVTYMALYYGLDV